MFALVDPLISPVAMTPLDIRPPIPGRDPMRSHARAIVACSLKIPFRTRGAAIKFAHWKRLDQHPYRCAICGDWHLTHQGHEA